MPPALQRHFREHASRHSVNRDLLLESCYESCMKACAHLCFPSQGERVEAKKLALRMGAQVGGRSQQRNRLPHEYKEVACCEASLVGPHGSLSHGGDAADHGGAGVRSGVC